uniref:CYFIP related Rac1 interactor B n=1 Tax=Propithecus coquereli TaxID=379532 RepID=A0A2K6GFI0_PROCO
MQKASWRTYSHTEELAIQHPADEKLQEKAWGAVVPLVGKLKKFYEFSQRPFLGIKIITLMNCSLFIFFFFRSSVKRSSGSFDKYPIFSYPASRARFAEILHFTLRFDELKMTNPAIQNDFSYYRRTLSRMRINNVPAEGENEVNNELANRMSLFYAEATPMLKTLSDATTKFVSEEVILCIVSLPSVADMMIFSKEYRSRFTNEETGNGGRHNTL